MEAAVDGREEREDREVAFAADKGEGGRGGGTADVEVPEAIDAEDDLRKGSGMAVCITNRWD